MSNFYQATAAAAYAQRRVTDPIPFWNRQLKNFNPFSILNQETWTTIRAYTANYGIHNLVRPKGILSVALVYGGSGWLYSVNYKNRYHQQYEYH